MINEHLLPCPFCANPTEQRFTLGQAEMYIQCSGCGARMFGDSDAAVVEKWNRRAPMTKDDLLRRALEVGFEYHDGRHADKCEACKLYLEIEAALKSSNEPVVTLTDRDSCPNCGFDVKDHEAGELARCGVNRTAPHD